jgi:ubiquinone/menaquinone biosynthesis C-methylase UbiE
MSKQEDIHKYWEEKTTASMYDKNLLDLEIDMISHELNSEDSVLDLGCGEGEGTSAYAKITKKIIATDFSDTRLRMLSERSPTIETRPLDMRELSPSLFDGPFNVVITQRSLINLLDFSQQLAVIKRIHQVLCDNGKYIMVEGFKNGDKGMNELREFLGLKPINERWHNCFFEEDDLINSIQDIFQLKRTRNLSTFYFLTRIVNAALNDTPKWDDNINLLAARLEKNFPNLMNPDLSRVKMLVFEKK